SSNFPTSALPASRRGTAPIRKVLTRSSKHSFFERLGFPTALGATNLAGTAARAENYKFSKPNPTRYGHAAQRVSLALDGARVGNSVPSRRFNHVFFAQK